jgi:hypothetical protein
MKKYILAVLILLLVGLGLSAIPAEAGLILNPTDDTYVDISIPDTNVDGYNLVTDYTTAGCIITRRVYLRFDASALPIDIGPLTRLRLYLTYPPIVSGPLGIFTTGDDWNGAAAGNGGETTLTWNNAPAVGTLLDTRTAGTTQTFVQFTGQNLANYLNSQRPANGGDGVASLALQWTACPDPDFDILAFEDRENFYGSGFIPEIAPASPTAVSLTSFTALAAGGAAGLPAALGGAALCAAGLAGLAWVKRRR